MAMTASPEKEACRTIKQSLKEYGRGLAGGLIFSLPLLYTMEVWWAGFVLRPDRLILYIVATFVLLLGYNRYAGLRRDASFTEVAIDSVEEMALGIVTAAVALWLLGRITSEMPAVEIVGKVVIEAMTVAIGVSVGTAHLGARSDEEASGEGEAEDQGQDGAEDLDRDDTLLGRTVITLCGAVLFAANIAPTEEVVVLATELASWRLLALAAVSIALASVILYFSDFAGSGDAFQSRRAAEVGATIALTYAIALFASGMTLWFFGRFDGLAPITMVSEMIVLGLPATLGASAGRLLLKA